MTLPPIVIKNYNTAMKKFGPEVFNCSYFRGHAIHINGEICNTFGFNFRQHIRY